MALHTLKKSVATPGTRVALAATRTPASNAIAQSLDGNTGPVYVGDSTVAYDASANGKSYTGHKLVPGDSVPLSELGGGSYLDLQNVFIDADNADDGVCVTYGRR
jgi:hypothetical protein